MENGNQQIELYENECYADGLRRYIRDYQSDYAMELRLNSELKIDNERQDIAKRRRIAIDSHYEHYIWPHYDYDEAVDFEKIIGEFAENLSVSVDEDYQNILLNLRDREYQRLQDEEEKEQQLMQNQAQHHGHLYRQKTAYDDEMEYIRQSLIIPPPPPPPPPPKDAYGRRRSIQHMNQSKILYQVDGRVEKDEKQWMRRLKMKKFEIYVGRKRHQRLQVKRIEIECKLQEMKTRVEEMFLFLFCFLIWVIGCTGCV